MKNMKIKHVIMDKWEYRIMKEMRISNYEWYENIKLWMIWECEIMNDMRMWNYERYENIKIMKDMKI